MTGVQRLTSTPRSADAELAPSASGPRLRVRVDATALEGLYREHNQFVWRNLLRLGVPQHALDDAVHDAFIVVAERLGEFEGRSSIKTWLFAIVYNVARGIRRDHGRAAARQEPLDDVREPPSGLSNPEVLSDAAQLLHRLLEALDEEKRVVFVMAELEQMTAPEIAQTLGLKVPTVYSRLRLARERLEKALHEIGDVP